MTSEPDTRSATQVSVLPRLTKGRVRIVDGADRGRQATVDVDAAPLVVGSAPDCDLTLRDTRVSRRHCEITLGAHGFLVHDLGSRNGTLFEGARVSELAVPIGAILKVGKTHLVLEAPGDRRRIDPSDRSSLGKLIGESLPMRRTFAMLERAAQSDVTVLLTGETGTGKELAAAALHQQGARANGPFEVLDCGAVSADLLPSALFGHVRGAFTGADQDRAGVFERAHGGTVFIDEIGELPLELQPALLRVCDQLTITRVGGAEQISVDVRIVAATNRDLAAEVLEGRFRRDLFYRLQVFPIELPPLRTRRDDLPLLGRRLLSDLGFEAIDELLQALLPTLAAHHWAGNVRELRNALERATALAQSGVAIADLPKQLDLRAPPPRTQVSNVPFRELKQHAIDRFERETLAELMREHDGNIRQVSRASGIERTQLKRMLRKHGLI